MQTLITDTTVVLPTGYIEHGYVICRDGRIAAIGQGDAPEGDYTHRLCGKGKYLTPGFVDIHVHGGAGAEFIDGTREGYMQILRAHLAGGTTTIVPTLSSGALETVLRAVEVFNELKEEEADLNSIPHLAGIHMEGPYFSLEQAGAQDPDIIHPPRKEEYMAILDATEHICRWSAACELEGALEFGRFLAERGIGVSIGHSNATTEEAERAVSYGYSSVTHLYSGCSLVHRNGPFREGGVVEAALLLDSLDVEMIADGAHLPRELLQLIYKIKGAEHVALVTDCIRCGGKSYADGTVLPYSKERNLSVVIERGVAIMPGGKSFAGSLATSSQLVRTMVHTAGVSLCDAVRMASLTPARLIGKDGEIGSIETGKRADILLLDHDLQVCEILMDGEPVTET